MKFQVTVNLKKEVLDPEGRAIHESLFQLGYKDLKNVEVSKRYILELEGPDAEAKAKEIAEKHLSNPVAQSFEMEAINS